MEENAQKVDQTPGGTVSCKWFLAVPVRRSGGRGKSRRMKGKENARLCSWDKGAKACAKTFVPRASSRGGALPSKGGRRNSLSARKSGEKEKNVKKKKAASAPVGGKNVERVFSSSKRIQRLLKGSIIGKMARAGKIAQLRRTPSPFIEEGRGGERLAF